MAVACLDFPASRPLPRQSLYMKTPRILTVFVCLPAVSWATTLPVGRGELSAGVDSMATYDSNLTANSQGVSDYYGSLTPNISYTRKAGQINANADFGVSFERYVDETQYNDNNINTDFDLHLDPDVSETLTGSLHAGYHEGSQIDSDLNTRVRMRTASFSGQSILITGPRTSVETSVGFSDDLRSAGSNQQNATAGTYFDYRGFLEDTTLRLSYDFSYTHSSGDNILGADLDQTSHDFLVGLGHPIYEDIMGRINAGYRILDRSARETTTGDTNENGVIFNATIDGPFLPGSLFPKLRSHFSISYESAPSPGINDPGDKTIQGSIGLSWQARPGTSAKVDFSRSQRLSASDFTVVTDTFEASVDQKLRYNLTGSIGLNYNVDSFRGVNREDKRFSAFGSLKYTFATNWSASASYTFESVRSNQRMSTYDRDVVTLGVSYRY